MTTELIDPPLVADETTTLLGYLDFYRQVLRRKVEGLTSEQLRTRLPGHPSPMSLGGILTHVACAEDWWFTVRIADRAEPEPWASAAEDDRDWDWHCADDMTPEQVLATFDAAIERSRAVSADLGPLDRPVTQAWHGEHPSVRWVVVHMIEENARHAGHADLLRELVDGTTGD